ncbi:hypothetical protein SAMD00019534_004520, partial [Acytostelium subglobosum LB1]|uniref:hypothetical protein n=1 Tax=Acytostelium subglobosum LB1 TaxID=1410327 RepID=UPI000644B15B
RRHPPGPLPLPLIGNLHSLGNKPHLALYKMYQKYGNVFRLRMGAVETVVLTEPATLHEAFVDNPTMFVDRYQRESRMLWNSGEAFDPINLVKICSLNIIFRFLFSHHFSYDLNGEAGEIVHLINHCFHLAGAKIPDDFIPLMKRFRRSRSDLMNDYIDTNIKVCKYIESIITIRLKTFNPDEEPKDILDHYLQEYFNGTIPLDGIVYSFADLVAAGTDSSANTVSALIKAMANRPKYQELMYCELSTITGEPTIAHKNSTQLTNAIIKETIRRYPTAPLGVPHAATEDCEFRGYHIKKGTQIFLNIYSTFMSPNVWQDPEEFDPNRFMGEDNPNNKIVRYIFGVGPRNCLGAALAEQELFLLTSILFKKFKFVRTTEEMMNEDMLFGLAFVPTPFQVKVEKR